LGPLVVTSILARVDPASDGARIATSKPRGALAKRVGDSKKLVAFDDNNLGEAWARAIVAYTEKRAIPVSSTPHAPPLTPTDLLSTIALDPDAVLRSPCPSQHADLCWGNEGEAFSSNDDSMGSCMRDLERLEARGFNVVGLRVAIVCTRKLNEAVTA